MQETIHEKPDQIERDYGFSISFADESAACVSRFTSDLSHAALHRFGDGPET